MIERYCTPNMTAIWSRQAKTQRWLDVEIAITEGYAESGLVAPSEMETIRRHAAFDLNRCDEIEKETRHDLMAFVRCVSESIQTAESDDGPSASRWIHFGVTSYDVIDTALGLMLRDSCEVLVGSIRGVRKAIHRLFESHGQVPCIGRTHGIHAEAITFGHKLEGWNEELIRAEERLQFHRDQVAVGKISGAVGIHAHVDRELESRICTKLGLRADPSSTQIVARDRHAALLTDVAVLAGSLERIATELRNLQRTEILEVQEEFAAGQTGSSAMPHKRNPWNAETICGLARIVRGNAHAMLESVMTWHERDLTNSSLERIVFPDTFQLVDFMLNRLSKILGGLVVLPDNMARNLRQMGDLVFSEHLMVALIQKGLSRESAYKAAQRNAAKAWDGADFKESVKTDDEVRAVLSDTELQEVFSLEHHLRNAPRELRNPPR
ncbi:MAG: Adenylosuccinate lyase [Fimbriimonadaceae bacterium]|nr:Adenylosuccinate lyase [Fimbriimonadaceae bacterium]